MKWIFAVLCVVLGMYGFYASERAQDIKPLAFCVIGFGSAYMLSKVWKETPGKISIAGSCFILVLALIAKSESFAMAVYSVTDIMLPENFFILWSICIVVLGVPFMTILMRYFD